MVIKSFGQLITVLTAMAAKLPDFAATLGTLPADQTFLDNSLANMEYLMAYVAQMDENKKAYTAIRQRAFNGDPGAIADGPVTDAFNPPFPLTGDILGQLMNLIRRIKGSNAYTREIGLALGIEEDSPAPPNPDTLQPTLHAFAAQDGYVYTSVIEGRAGYDMWEIEVQALTADTWTNLGRFSGKSQDLTFTPSPADAGKPVQIRLRVRLWKGAAHVGLWSAEVVITVNP